MPIYEYACQACGCEFSELILRGRDEEEVKCPSCGSEEKRRLISRVRFHLSESDRVDRYDPKARQDDGFYRDTRNIGLSAKKRIKEMGVNLGSGFEEKLEKARSSPSKFINEKD